jgi:hypothetical protein
MRKGSRIKEFFQDGGIVAARQDGALARMIAGLGLAALVAVVPAETTSADGRHLYPNPHKSLPDTRLAALPDFADSFLAAHVAEVVENTTFHRYGDYNVPHALVKAIVRAASDTDFPADYLMAIAEKESSFRADARPDRGTARGYFGFIEQTWLSAIKRNGAAYGLGDAAAAIVQKKNSRGLSYYEIGEPRLRKEILGLREDPYVSAIMTALDLKDARMRIESRIDAVMQDEDMYLPHFLGEDSAQDVIAASEDKPSASARGLLPRAARYNKAIFHDKRGHPLTVVQFRKRAQDVIATRAQKYARVDADVERASYAPDRSVITGTVPKPAHHDGNGDANHSIPRR